MIGKFNEKVDDGGIRVNRVQYGNLRDGGEMHECKLPSGPEHPQKREGFGFA